MMRDQSGCVESVPVVVASRILSPSHYAADPNLWRAEVAPLA